LLQGTLVHALAREGKANALELLLQSGADPTCRDASGQDPLQLALAARHVAVSRILINRISLSLSLSFSCLV
jgi:ankyrin repeat protein